jgi:small subunit ribosomal protein S17
MERNLRKERTGVVISNKMDKSIVISVDRRVKHPIYGKFVRKSTKLMAHDDQNSANIGDTVKIMETKPLSRNKCWRLVEIIERAK